ncbi:MAG: hypothetical protein HeimC3_46640 [Candidatus Heimdallarchaeota archaeon LC_3]|nr:MAG: hypothetical protein HeimC3_46640 [Candidatus Heimdallarchaeota archaeon LC_3]
MTITLENKIAEDLIKFKLNSVQETLNNILTKWNQDNAEDFILKAKSGSLEDAELDGITVKQLVKDIDDLNNLLKTIK